MINEEIKQKFWFNLLVVVALATCLYILFFISLGFITRHGKEMKVPNVTKQNIKHAQESLESLGFEVVIDSAYEPKQKPFIVLSQIPDTGAVVKNGRTVFLTVNKKDPPATPMPNLVGLSFRSAEMILKNNKLFLGDTSYRPDIAKGAILEQSYRGRIIRPGEMVPQGSRISLVIGEGLGNVQINMPDVIGYTYEEAVNLLAGTGLQYYTIFEGEISDTAAAVIYNQSPKPFNEIGEPNRIKEGDMVDIYIKQTATMEEMEGNKKDGIPLDEEP